MRHGWFAIGREAHNWGQTDHPQDAEAGLLFHSLLVFGVLAHGLPAHMVERL